MQICKCGWYNWGCSNTCTKCGDTLWEEKPSYGCGCCTFSDYGGKCSVGQESNCSKRHSTHTEFLKEVERLNEIQHRERNTV